MFVVDKIFQWVCSSLCERNIIQYDFDVKFSLNNNGNLTLSKFKIKDINKRMQNYQFIVRNEEDNSHIVFNEFCKFVEFSIKNEVVGVSIAYNVCPTTYLPLDCIVTICSMNRFEYELFNLLKFDSKSFLLDFDRSLGLADSCIIVESIDSDGVYVHVINKENTSIMNLIYQSFKNGLKVVTIEDDNLYVNAPHMVSAYKGSGVYVRYCYKISDVNKFSTILTKNILMR